MSTWSKHRVLLCALLTAAAVAASHASAVAADVVHPADPGGSTFTTGLDGWVVAQSVCADPFNPGSPCSSVDVGHGGDELRLTRSGDLGFRTVVVQSPAFTVGAAPSSAIFSMRQRSPLAEEPFWATTVTLLDVAAGTRRTILTDPEDRTDAAFGIFVERAAPVDGLVPGRTYQLEISTLVTGAATVLAYDDVKLRVIDPGAAAPPALATVGAAPGADQATVRSWVNPRGTATTVHYEYGTTTAYGAQTTPAAIGAGTAGVAHEAPATALQPCTTYHYRAVATSMHGTSTGADQTFWTACRPSPGHITAGPFRFSPEDPGALHPAEVSLAGSVQPNGLPTEYYFDYGMTTAYGRSTPRTATAALPRRHRGGAFAFARLPQLEFGTVYHMRLVATNAVGTSVGPDFMFRTSRVPVPPAPPPVPALGAPPFAAKLEIARAEVNRSERRLSVLAAITARASGEVKAEFRAAGRTERFDAEVDSDNRRVRINRRIHASQARLGTGILTLTYDGDSNTQPQQVRLRAASRKANLDASRPRIAKGRLTATGEISSRARGVVRLQLLYEPPGRRTRTLEFTARIRDGRYRFDERLPADVLAGIAQRRGVVHSYTLFTGYLENRIRGEMSSYQVRGNR